MNLAKILYVDHHGVFLTRFTLKVKKRSYPLKEIFGYHPVVISPKRTMGIISLIVGFIMVSSGYVNAASSSLRINTLGIEKLWDASVLSVYGGIALITLGILGVVLSKVRYALQIATSEGIRNVIESADKKYIIRIVHMLNNAAEENERYHSKQESVHVRYEQYGTISLN